MKLKIKFSSFLPLKNKGLFLTKVRQIVEPLYSNILTLSKVA